MDDVVKAISRHRTALARGQQRATRQLAQSYAQVWASVRADWQALSQQIDDALLAGEEVSPAWLERQYRYRNLMLNLEASLVGLGPTVERVAGPLVDEALAAGARDAAELVGLVSGGPQDVAQAAVGYTTRGPVAQLIAARAGDQAEQAAAVIREGIVRGYAPRKTAARLQRVTGGAFANANTVVRTEQMRAYREATRQTYLANPVIEQWVWMSRQSDRTCGFCWAMDGRKFAVDRVMPTHPNCACAMAPVVPGLDDGPTGPDVFETLPDASKRRVLGPVAHAAYANGELALPDLVQLGRHRTWGPTGRQKPLGAILGADRVAELRAGLRG